jgi:hypothetical protein
VEKKVSRYRVNQKSEKTSEPIGSLVEEADRKGRTNEAGSTVVGKE